MVNSSKNLDMSKILSNHKTPSHFTFPRLNTTMEAVQDQLEIVVVEHQQILLYHNRFYKKMRNCSKTIIYHQKRLIIIKIVYSVGKMD